MQHYQCSRQYDFTRPLIDLASSFCPFSWQWIDKPSASLCGAIRTSMCNGMTSAFCSLPFDQTVKETDRPLNSLGSITQVSSFPFDSARVCERAEEPFDRIEKKPPLMVSLCSLLRIYDESVCR